MKIFDENDVEVPESEINDDLGYTTQEQKLIKHHDAIPAVPEKNHFEVRTFYFDDGTSMKVTSQNDPHIQKINPEKGIFGYIDRGEGKRVRGIDLVTVIDTPAEPEQAAWDEYEDFLRWHPYTEEEIQNRQDAKEAEEKRQEFINNGSVYLEEVKQNVTAAEDRITANEERLDKTTSRIEENEARLDDTVMSVEDLSVAFVELMENL